MTKMMKVKTILKTVMGSCDFEDVADYDGKTMGVKRTNFWKEVIAVKSKDTGFGYLVESIIENGFTGSAIGWNPETKEITEGHHRLVAAILLGLDEVPVARWGASGDHAPTPGNSVFSAHWCEDAPYPIAVTFD